MSRFSLSNRPVFLQRGRKTYFPRAPWGPPVMVGCCVLLAALVILRFLEPEAGVVTEESSAASLREEQELLSSEEEETLSSAPAPLNQTLPQEESSLQMAEFLSPDASSSVEEGPITEAEASASLEALREVFPEGWYWNHVGVENWDEFTVTQYSCQHDLYWDTYCNTYVGATQTLFPQFYPLEQCLGFASLLSDLVFGEDAPLTVFYDYSQLRVGDHIRLELTEHSMTVLTVEEDGITVVECNSDYEHCRISWDRFLSWDDLAAYSYEMECITRYED